MDFVPANVSDASPLTDWLLVSSAAMHLKLDQARLEVAARL